MMFYSGRSCEIAWKTTVLVIKSVTVASAVIALLSACSGPSSQPSGQSPSQSASYQQGYNDGANWARKNYVQQSGPQSGLPDYVVNDWCRLFLSQYQSGLNKPMPASTADYTQGCRNGFGILRHN